MDKVAFLPFGLMVDRYRWSLFDGSVKPADYNEAWTQLRYQYQGIVPPVPRGPESFDPGAKYHVPGNVPYTRYFLARILQFQFFKAACDQAGWTGRSEEHTPELQSLMRISYAVFCLKTKQKNYIHPHHIYLLKTIH